MKIFRFLIVVCIIFLVSGCTNNEETKQYKNMMQKGMYAVTENQFYKAEGYFEIALDTVPSDQKAKVYLSQVQQIIKATEAIKDRDLSSAQLRLTKVIEMKNGSKLLIEKARQVQEEI